MAEKNGNNFRRIVICGASGGVGSSLAFLVGAGALDDGLTIVLQDVEQARGRLLGLKMEIEDSCFPGVEAIDVVSSLADAVNDQTDYVIFCASVPLPMKAVTMCSRTALLLSNCRMYVEFGQVLNRNGNPARLKVIVVANPVNTLTYVLTRNAPKLPPKAFSGLMALDVNRAKARLQHLLDVDSIQNLVVWGNHGPTAFPDYSHAVAVVSVPSAHNEAPEIVNTAHTEQIYQLHHRPQSFSNNVECDGLDMTTTLSDVENFMHRRGWEIVNTYDKKHGATYSTALATLKHIQALQGQPCADEYVSMAVPSDGSYGVPSGLVFSFPCTVVGGKLCIASGFDPDNVMISKNVDVLTKEISILESNESD